MLPLKSILDNASHVKIKSPSIDLSFGIYNFLSEICSGKINIPDGEVFIAPELDSTNGFIQFNVPARYQGNAFSNIFLRFENGRIIECYSNSNNALFQQIIASDNGNRYIGEFAIGTNPSIVEPRSNILFDEKILGSFHIALGNSHSLSDNGNKATIHWDMVNMLTKKYGGGRIIIDDRLIQEDGIFVLSELQDLNKSKILRR